MTKEQDLELQGFFDKYHKSIFHSALMILKNVSAAEDVMQEVFMKLMISYKKEDAQHFTMRCFQSLKVMNVKFSSYMLQVN